MAVGGGRIVRLTNSNIMNGTPYRQQRERQSGSRQRVRFGI
jgi:hypothetical protein